MSEEHVDRIRGDLQALRDAVGLDLPFGRADVHAAVWTAGCGALIAAWSALADWQWRGFIGLPLAMAVVGAAWSARQAHSSRAARPSQWREHRMGMMAMLIVAPLAYGYIQWEKWVGMPREMVGSAPLFFIGLGALMFAFLDRRRMYYAGGGVQLMVLGLMMPLLSPQQVIIAIGVNMAVGCLLVAGIQMVQLRRQGDLDGAH